MFKRKNISGQESDTASPKGFDDYDLRIGDELRGERATKGLSLSDVEASLKIKARYLEAIENAELDVFDAKSFIPGYVRSYAKFLGLDPENVFRRFCHESGFELAKGIGTERKTRAETPSSRTAAVKDPLLDSRTPFAPQTESFMDRLQPGAIGSILVLLAVLGGVGYGAWYALKEVQRVQLAPVEQAPEIAQLDPVEQLSPPSIGEGEDEFAGNVRFERVYRPDALDLPVVESRDAPISRLNPHEIGTLVAPEAQNTTLAEVREEPLPVPQVSEARPQQVALMVTRPAWVRIETADGTRIFEKNMEVGEEFVLPATEAAPLLRAGMSGFVYFRVGEELYGPVGSGAQIVSQIEIDKDSVMNQFALADPAANDELARAVALADASQ